MAGIVGQAALPAINTLLQLEGTTVANVSSITGPGLSVKVQDVTSHSTLVPWRQKFPTLLDGGDITFALFFLPSDSGHQALLAGFTSRFQATGYTANWSVVFPDDAATTWTLQGFINKFSMKAPVDGVITADLSITVTGAPVFP